MSLPKYIGVVSLSPQIKTADLLAVTAAIQKQVTRDFAPIWNVEASISVFDKIADVPLGYWRVLIADNDSRVPSGANGVHLDNQQQPFAIVLARVGWGFTLSHEILEMLADPFGNTLVVGNSPYLSQGRVLFLAEVCDPCESPDYGYPIDGFLMSDFYTPRYFDPFASQGVRYSMSDAIAEPRQVLSGGYLSWLEPISNDWFQAQYFNGGLVIKNLGKLTFQGSIRATIDRVTNPLADEEMQKTLNASESINGLRIETAGMHLVSPYAEACQARGASLLAQVNQILNTEFSVNETSENIVRRPPRKRKQTN